MPIGEFENWRACIKAQIAKGYSKDAAEGIWGMGTRYVRECKHLEELITNFKFLNNEFKPLTKKQIKKDLNDQLIEFYIETKSIKIAYISYYTYLKEAYGDVIGSFKEDVDYLNDFR